MGVCVNPTASRLVQQIYVARRLREALQLVDIRVLDHMIVADNGCLSFAERGLM
jgi:DNA repair protein RadC